MTDELDHREKLRSASKGLLIAGVVSFAIMLGLEVYFWDTCPTVRDVASGSAIAEFDKLHDRYVYLPKMQHGSFLAFSFVACICIASSVIVALALEKLEARSKQRLDRSED